jgi:trans-L-3-hydroxyproline dehydratase
MTNVYSDPRFNGGYQLTTLDYHTAGEPLRIITSGLPEIPGDSMLARRRFMADQLDDYRMLLMREPRGHSEMYGAVLTPPVTDDGDTGVLFLHNGGYSTMCGHAIIALATAAVEQQLFPVDDPESIRIDTPAGQVVARAHLNEDGSVREVSFRNVPSFVLEPLFPVRVDGRAVNITIAFGGAFYAYLDAEALGFRLQPEEAPRLVELARKVKKAVSTQYRIVHPDGDDDLNFLYGCIFVRPGESPNQSRNACVFADGQLDRSPTGTGVSGRAAIHWTRGELGLGESLEIESIIGTRFRVRCLEETQVGGIRAVIPEVSGRASLTGKHEFVLDPRDPLPRGLHIGTQRSG